MKNITSFSIMLLLFLTIQNLNAQTCISGNLSHLENRYKYQQHFIPKPSDNVKTLRVNFHVIQYKVGDERNFVNINQHKYFLNRVIDSLNNGYAGLKSPDYPQTCVCGTECYIQDTRLRVELKNIYFHLDSLLYGSYDPFPLLNKYPTNNDTEYNIYITSGVWGGRSMFPDYNNLNKEQGFVGRGYKTTYDSTLDTSLPDSNLHYAAQQIATHLQHEIGHAYGLKHLYPSGESTNPITLDYLWDYFGAGTSGCPKRPFGVGAWCNTKSITCQANWMGGFNGDVLHRELTPLQIGRIHRSTMLSSVRKYFKPSANHVADNVIDINETWYFDIRMYGDIVVDSGATLTIHCKVLMPPEGEIKVNANGKLIVDGGTITSTEDGPNNQWAGIRVEGSTSYSQYQSYSFGLAHGTVEIKNNALIENATEAIVTTEYPNKRGGSGVVKAYNSTFRNNSYGIRMGKYQDIGVHKNKANHSEFVGCTFEWDSTFLKPTTSIKSGIELIGVKRIKVDSCTFIHLYPPAQSFKPRIGIGIMTADASPIIKNCSFENMENGIKVQSLLGTEPVTVQYNTFKNNYLGSHIMKSEYTILQQNSYNTATQRGIVLAETKAFKISENGFYNGTIGIENRNLGYHSNEIYNNTFTGQNTGIIALGYSNQSNKGLSFKCNLFATDLIRYRDINVMVGKVDSVQGRCLDNDILQKYNSPSGNEFSHTCANNSYGDFYALNHPSKIDYAHHYQFLSGAYIPSCYTSTKIKTNNCITSYHNSKSCPDSTHKQTSSSTQWVTNSSGVKGQYNYQKQEYVLAEYNFALLIDGGNTSGLLNYIDPASNNSSDQIKTEMIDESPYLSEAVLKACINRNPALNNTDLYQILNANSPLSIELANSLGGLTNVLTTSQITNLQAIQDGISKRDSVQNRVRWHKQQAELALNELLRLFALDTHAGDPIDSMIHYLENWNTPESNELLVPLYWQKEDFVKAQISINAVANEDGNEHLDFVLQKLHDMLDNGDSIPILLGDTLALDSIALDSNKAGQMWAQNVMFQLTGKHYPVYLPDTGAVSGIILEPENNTLVADEEQNENGINVFPNPSHGELTIQFNGLKAVNVRVYTMEGKMVIEKDISNSESKIQIRMEKGLSGVFQLVVYGESDTIVHTEKIIVSNE